MTVIAISDALRGCASSPDQTADGFMGDLLSGRRGRDDYVALIAQHFFVYRALEAAADRLAGDPLVARFVSPGPVRTAALEQDLEFLIGPAWSERIAPLPTVTRYVERIALVAATWPAGYIAHHYTRYLGDLSGGRIISRIMQREFGFQTNGVGFYLFDGIADPRAFREHYRAELDRADWSADECRRVADEVRRAYAYNARLFADLASRPAAQAPAAS